MTTPAELTDGDWSTIRRALAIYYKKVKANIARAQRAHAKPGKTNLARPSELAMEAADVFQVYERVRALHPRPAAPATDGDVTRLPPFVPYDPTITKGGKP